MGIFDRLLRRHIKQTVAEAITKVINERLPSMVEEIIAKKLEREPDLPLSEAGFGWALSIALRKHWPDLDAKTAAHWLWGYIGVPFGSKGYAWTYAAAQDIARQYVGEFGEPRHD